MSEEALIVIPARGGSKGLPRKNLCCVGGQSLIVRAVMTAHASAVGPVAVSSDDAWILREAERCGAMTIERPAELAGDDSLVECTILHALQTVEQRLCREMANVVMLQCTSPFTDVADVLDCVLKLDECDCATTVVRSQSVMWEHPSDMAGQSRAPRQSRMQMCETGGVYAWRRDVFLECMRSSPPLRYAGKCGWVEVAKERAIEIDDALDLWVADQLAWRAKGQGIDAWTAALPKRVTHVCIDFDGVLTDDHVDVDDAGRESVQCCKADSIGIAMLQSAGVDVRIISGETSGHARHRAAKLGLTLHSTQDKSAVLRALSDDMSGVVYVGNDANDIPALRAAGCGLVPLGTEESIARFAKGMIPVDGGHGVIRELAEALLNLGRLPMTAPRLGA